MQAAGVDPLPPTRANPYLSFATVTALYRVERDSVLVDLIELMNFCSVIEWSACAKLTRAITDSITANLRVLTMFYIN